MHPFFFKYSVAWVGGRNRIPAPRQLLGFESLQPQPLLNLIAIPAAATTAWILIPACGCNRCLDSNPCGRYDCLDSNPYSRDRCLHGFPLVPESSKKCGVVFPVDFRGLDVPVHPLHKGLVLLLEPPDGVPAEVKKYIYVGWTVPVTTHLLTKN